MIRTHHDILTRFLPLLFGAGVAVIAAGTVMAGQAGASSEPVACQIEASAQGRMIALTGVVNAEAPVTGSYTFKVTSAGGAGNTNIRQGGGFSAGPDGPVSLGSVMLGNSGQVYEASLVINAGGKTFQCAERVGGVI